MGTSQNSLNAIFELMSFVLALVFNDVAHFEILAYVSFCMVTAAMVLYSVYYVKSESTFPFSSTRPRAWGVSEVYAMHRHLYLHFRLHSYLHLHHSQTNQVVSTQTNQVITTCVGLSIL